MAIHIKIFELISILVIITSVFNQIDSTNSNSSNNSTEPTRYYYALNNAKLREFAEPELQFYRMIKKLVKENVNLTCQKSLLSYIEDYEEGMEVTQLQNKLNQFTAISTTNPLKIFKQIWRLAKKYPEIKSSCESTEISRILKLFEDSCNTLKILLPTKVDLKNAVAGMHRIQLAYQLDTRLVSQGIIGNLKTGVKLNYENCVEIGRITATLLKEYGQIHFAIEWLEIGRDLAFKKLGHSAFTSELDSDIKKLHLQHDEMWDTLGNPYQLQLFSEKLAENNSTDNQTEKYISRKKQGQDLWKNGRQSKFSKGLSKDDRNTHTSWNLCKGGNIQTNLQKPKLKCYSSRSLHPFFLINPLQIELLNEDPVLIQIYNIVGNTAIQKLLEDAKPHLIESHKYTSAGRLYPTYSVSEKDYLRPLYKTFEFITGLSILGTASEDGTVMEYTTLGPYYLTHTDVKTVFLEEDRNLTNEVDRKFRKPRYLTSFLFYLHDVEMGGSTAFPLLGLAAKPIKNSVTFWYNLYPNMTELDERTEHLSCPVAFGRKGISSKWVYANPNMFKHKCPLDRYATNRPQLLQGLNALP